MSSPSDATYATHPALSRRLRPRIRPHRTQGSGCHNPPKGGIPGKDDREFINRSIYADLAAGNVTQELRRRYLEICQRQIEDTGVEAIILGCTEIPLVLSPDDFSVPLIDTARYHAEALFSYAIDED